jgi:hypothetical protein
VGRARRGHGTPSLSHWRRRPAGMVLRLVTGSESVRDSDDPIDVHPYDSAKKHSFDFVDSMYFICPDSLVAAAVTVSDCTRTVTDSPKCKSRQPEGRMQSACCNNTDFARPVHWHVVAPDSRRSSPWSIVRKRSISVCKDTKHAGFEVKDGFFCRGEG